MLYTASGQCQVKEDFRLRRVVPSEDHTLWHQLRDWGLGCLSTMFMRLISHNHGTLVTHVVSPAPSHDSSSRMRKLIKGSFRNPERWSGSLGFSCYCRHYLMQMKHLLGTNSSHNGRNSLDQRGCWDEWDVYNTALPLHCDPGQINLSMPPIPHL